MTYDYSRQIYSDNRDYHQRMQVEGESYHRKTLEEQAAMRRLMEQQAVMELERQREEASNQAYIQQVQAVQRAFQERMEKGKQLLERGAFPAAILEFNSAEQVMTGELKTLKELFLLIDYRTAISCNLVGKLNDFERRWKQLAPELYHERGLTYLIYKKYFEAIKDFTSWIEIEGNQIDAYNLRAKANMRLARSLGASPVAPDLEIKSVIHDLETSLQLSPYQEATQARLVFARADFLKAIPALERLVSQRDIPAPERVELAEFLGDAYRKTGKMQEALGSYEIALSLLPDHMQYFEQIEILRTKKGDILLDMGREDSAVTEYRKAREKNEKNPLCFIPEATKGDVEKQFLIGMALFKGSVAIEKNWAKAVRWLRDCGKKEAYMCLGEVHEKGGFGVEKNWKSAVDFYTAVGNGNSGLSAGKLLMLGGEGLEKDLPRAIVCFRYATEHAEPSQRIEAFYILGSLLGQAAELPHNFSEALQFYKAVADSTEWINTQKKGEAAYSVGLWYLEGREGVQRDLDGALQYLEKAHLAGHAVAKAVLARTRFEIAERANEKSTVLNHYTAAADLGHGIAAFRAGELYRLGATGIPQNPREARKYLEIAANGGIQGASEALKALDSCCVIL